MSGPGRFLSVPAFARGALAAAAALVLLELGLRAGEAAREARRAPRVRPGAYRVYALGESTTAPQAGEGGEDVSWPAQLERALRRDVPGAVVDNLAEPGCDTERQLGRLEAALAAGKPDLVVAMLGVNDWNKPARRGRLEGLRIAALLRSARSALLRRADRGAFNSERPRSGAERDRFLRLTALQARAVDLCGLGRAPSPACRALASAVWEEASGSLRRGDRSRRVFHFALYAALALDRHEDAAGLVAAYGALGVISIPSADLIHRLLRERPDLLGAGAAEPEGGRYAATRRGFLRLVGLARAHGVPVVFMQYPAVPAAPLRRLLAPGAPETRFSSYPESLRARFPGTPGPSPAPVVSNEFMSAAAARLGYDALYLDRFAFSFGAPFGHMAEAGHRLVAENLRRELRVAGLAP